MIENKILDGLNGLGEISASLNCDFKKLEALNVTMAEKCMSHRQSVEAILKITTGKSNADLRDAVLAARWEYRDQSLVMAEASRVLGTMAAKMKSIGESMAAMIATEGEETL